MVGGYWMPAFAGMTASFAAAIPVKLSIKTKPPPMWGGGLSLM